MQKIVIQIIFLGIGICSAAYASHLSGLHALYPFGLLGDDYGLLNETDLAANTCGADPMPFSPESMAYPYWQCFQTKVVSFKCELADYDESEKAQMAAIGITVSLADKKHDYTSRRAIDLSNCKWFQSEWKRITKDEKYTCLSGPRGGDEDVVEGTEHVYWVFDKFKTSKGCVSFFHGDCNLRYQLKRGCKISRLGATKFKAGG